MHQACKFKALYLHCKGCPLRPWGEPWRLGHGADCCCGGSLGVCIPVGMCLCMFAATRVCMCMCVCTNVYIWVVCLTHLCTCISLMCVHVCKCASACVSPPQPATHTRTHQENPRDPGGDGREDQVSGSGATGSSQVLGPEAQPRS